MNPRSIKVDNFNFSEVVYRPDDLPKELETIAFIVMGYLQCLRECAKLHFKKDVGIVITSGYRKPAVNKATPGSASNSYHQWRVDSKGQAVWAVDTRPIGVGLFDWYTFCQAVVVGEVYLNRAEGIVHISSYGPDEAFVV